MDVTHIRPAMPAMPTLLTVPEAAHRLAIGRSHLYKLLQSGALPSIAIGRCRRIRTVDLDDFITSGDREREPSLWR